MKYDSLNNYLKCIEAVLSLEYNNLNLLWGTCNISNLNLESIIKLLPKKANESEFIDFNSIANSNGNGKSNHLVQVDILLSLSEPVWLFKHNNSNSKYLIIKFYNKNIKHSLLYSYENLQLIDSFLKLWLQSLSQFDSEANQSSINYTLISKNQLIKIETLNNELNKCKEFIEQFVTKVSSYLISEGSNEIINITLSDSTIEFIKNYTQGIDELKTILQKAFAVAQNLSPENKIKRIKRYFIEDANSDFIEKNTTKPIIKINKYEKKPKSFQIILRMKIQNFTKQRLCLTDMKKLLKNYN